MTWWKIILVVITVGIILKDVVSAICEAIIIVEGYKNDKVE